MKKTNSTNDGSHSLKTGAMSRTAEKTKLRSKARAWTSIQFALTDEEWAHLRTLRAFEGGRTGSAGQARQFLNGAINVYCRDTISQISAREVKEVLKDVAKKLKEIQPYVDELAELNNIRQGFQSFELLGPNYPLELRNEKFQEFRRFVDLLEKAATALPRGKSGQQNQNVVTLVRGIQQVLSYTSGDEGLSRSGNYQMPAGRNTGSRTLNDKAFVEAVFEIAQRRTKIKIGKGSIDEAMKNSISDRRKVRC